MNRLAEFMAEADVQGILAQLSSKGITLWSAGGQLRYRAPKGSLTPEDVHTLLRYRNELLAALERIPLAFSQLAHWHSSDLRVRPSVRHIASATRVMGPWDADLFQRSLAELVRRHEALRTTVVLVDDAPMLKVASAGSFMCRMHDLSHFDPQQRELQLASVIRSALLEQVVVVEGELTVAHLIRLGPTEHAFVLAMEHIVSDVVSMNILTHELLTIYRGLTRGVPIELPSVPMQFSEYARRQQSDHARWLAKHGRYWSERLKDCGRLRFPPDVQAPTEGVAGWGTVPVLVGSALKAELTQWCRRHRTTLVLAILTTFVATVLHWCKSTDAVIRYQTSGRSEPRVMHTIGYFASMLHLRVQLPDRGDLLHLLGVVTAEYCNAYDHHDFSYLEAQVPPPGYTRNPCFNWISRDAAAARTEAGAGPNGLTTEPIRFANPRLESYERDAEPVLLVYEGQYEIAGGLHFPRSRLSARGMERFVARFFENLETLLREPEQILRSDRQDKSACSQSNLIDQVRSG